MTFNFTAPPSRSSVSNKQMQISHSVSVVKYDCAVFTFPDLPECAMDSRVLCPTFNHFEFNKSSQVCKQKELIRFSYRV